MGRGGWLCGLRSPSGTFSAAPSCLPLYESRILCTCYGLWPSHVTVSVLTCAWAVEPVEWATGMQITGLRDMSAGANFTLPVSSEEGAGKQL